MILDINISQNGIDISLIFNYPTSLRTCIILSIALKTTIILMINQETKIKILILHYYVIFMLRFYKN